tara:strand:+ start:910 stop:1812 length:903 start_codon:yes stop_codon:yes gene_type:complete
VGLFVSFFICSATINVAPVLASDFSLTCKTYYGSSDKNTTEQNINAFDVIFLGTVSKATDPTQLHNVKFKEEDYYVTFTVDEMFKNDGSSTFYEDGIAVLISARGGSALSSVDGQCLDVIGYHSIGKRYLIFAKNNPKYNVPEIWRASERVLLEEGQAAELPLKSDLVFIGRYKETVKKVSMKRKNPETGQVMYSPGGNTVYDNKHLTRFSVLEYLTNAHDKKTVTQNTKHEVLVWHDLSSDVKSSTPKMDYLIYASKKGDTEEYVAHNISVYLDRELNILRELTQHKSFRDEAMGGTVK